ncbi:GNAT family N-acetyltransferase [Alcaligenaceae bacterium]|nr:GNAT family N-acetyltransferase [Alcaligenaceae bacterium]
MYIDINTLAELKERKQEIQTLFAASFDMPFNVADWNWFYLENPSGPAYVSLFYDGGRLLGHYAVIPTTLNCNGKKIIAYRSMTTMVHPDGRGRGLFTDLANRVYTMLQADGASLVYGFPNENSTPGFVKHLGWTVLPPDPIVDLIGSKLLADQGLIDVLTEKADIEWDTQNQAQAAWRTARPETEFSVEPGLIVKHYDGIRNILHLDQNGLKSIHPTEVYRVLVPQHIRPNNVEKITVFNYQFGYRVFDQSLTNSTIKRELILSDVF